MLDASKLFDLAGQVAVVTGASRGLGRGLAGALAGAGAEIVAVSRHPAEALSADVERLGGRCQSLTADLRDPAQVDEVIPRALAAAGRVDILVNNAGATWGAPVVEMPLEAWHKVMETNVTGTFLMAQTVGRAMIDACRGGKIINIASIGGIVGADPRVMDAIGYSASKGAVIAFTRDLAVKLAPHRITVNAIAPGFFLTKMTRWLIEHQEKAILDTIPMGRLGGEDDLKGAAVFLASRASAFMTGQVLVVDGGATAW